MASVAGVAELEELLKGKDAAAGPAERGAESIKLVRRLYAPRAGLRCLGTAGAVAAKWPLLAELDLSGNNLRELPHGLGALHGLRKLYLQCNRISALPDDLCRAGSCSDLRELWVDHNDLSSLPADWTGLQRLVSLHVGWNRLAVLPGSICHLRRLSELLVQHNILEALPPGLGCMPQLRCLAARSNRLKHIPAALGDAPCLGRLLLGANPLSSVGTVAFPPSLGFCPMTELYLSGCGLQQLPLALRGYGATLRWLDVSDNCIANFPDWMIELQALQWIDCEYNQLKAISPAMTCWLSELNGVGLAGNPLSQWPNIADLDAHLVPSALRHCCGISDSSYEFGGQETVRLYRRLHLEGSREWRALREMCREHSKSCRFYSKGGLIYGVVPRTIAATLLAMCLSAVINLVLSCRIYTSSRVRRRYSAHTWILALCLGSVVGIAICVMLALLDCKYWRRRMRL